MPFISITKREEDVQKTTLDRKERQGRAKHAKKTDHGSFATFAMPWRSLRLETFAALRWSLGPAVKGFFCDFIYTSSPTWNRSRNNPLPS